MRSRLYTWTTSLLIAAIALAGIRSDAAPVYTNFARSTLAAGITSGATSITVVSGAGFPVVAGSDHAWVVIEAGPANNPTRREVVKVTAHSSGSASFTVVRGQQGTAAVAFNAGDRFEHRVTAQDLTDAAAPGVTLPGSSTDNAIVRWDGTSGTAIQNSNATIDDTGNLVIPGTHSWSGDIAPSAISGVVDDYNPTGLSGASVIRQDLSADATLGGLAGGVDGREITIFNIDTVYNLTIYPGSAGSSAANRFETPQNTPYVIPPRGAARLQYDSLSSLWRTVSVAPGVTNGLGGGPGPTYQLWQVRYYANCSGGSVLDNFGWNVTEAGAGGQCCGRGNHNLATTNFRLSRNACPKNGASTSVIGFRSGGADQGYFRGASGKIGGFDVRIRFSYSEDTASEAFFCGLDETQAGYALTAGDPSSLTTRHFIGLAHDPSSSGSAYKVYRNDASGTPSNATASISRSTTTQFEVRYVAEASAAGITVELRDLGSGAFWSETYTSDLPSATVLLHPKCEKHPHSVATDIEVATMVGMEAF
jgi:hypothetical protein